MTILLENDWEIVRERELAGQISLATTTLGQRKIYFFPFILQETIQIL
jgi:hypothetical protein